MGVGLGLSPGYHVLLRVCVCVCTRVVDSFLAVGLSRRRRKRPSTSVRMPLAQAHPWQSMPVKEEDNGGDQEVSARLTCVRGAFIAPRFASVRSESAVRNTEEVLLYSVKCRLPNYS